MTKPSQEAQAYVRKFIRAFGHPPSVADLTRLAALAFDAGAESGHTRLYDEGYRDGQRGSKIENVSPDPAKN